MAKRYILILAVLVPLWLCAQALSMVIAAGIIFGVAMSGATPFCPWGHKIRDLAMCEISDRKGSTLLIQHAELDINESYVEIRREDGSSFFQPPEAQTVFIQHGLRLHGPSSDVFRLANRELVLQKIDGPTF